jgi:hypothetical protein
MSPALFALVIFQIGSYFLPGSTLNHSSPTPTSQVAWISGMSHHDSVAIILNNVRYLLNVHIFQKCDSNFHMCVYVHIVYIYNVYVCVYVYVHIYIYTSRREGKKRERGGIECPKITECSLWIA